jgi:phosphoenolpyruvate carboxykinase (GTP)
VEGRTLRLRPGDAGRRKIGEREGANLPKIFYVNWFRKSDGGDFLWPGFGENGRVLKWIFERCAGTAKAVETPIGNLPGEGAIDVSGLDDVLREDLRELLRVDIDGWLAELPLIAAYYDKFGTHLPSELRDELEGMRTRLEAARN